jgi:hypothetical protein
MPDDKRLENLSEEIKLLKGEIKNSLTSVRDYLLNMELPSSEFSTILAALSGDNSGQKVSLDGGLGNGPPKNETPIDEPEITADDLKQPPPDEPLIDMEEPENLMEDAPEEPEMMIEQEEEVEEAPAAEQEEAPVAELDEPENIEDEVEEEEEEKEEEEEEEEIEDTAGEMEEPENEIDELPELENEDSGLAQDTTAEEEQPMELERTTTDTNPGTPKVNMLANLINWVARAKREIGDDLLPTFLDVYGVSGHLSLELKEVILHLAERTKEKTEPCTDAEVWSQAMLSLHGILTGGDAPLNPTIPSWKDAFMGDAEDIEDEIIEVDKQEKPVKLKFVFPGGNGHGKQKEYCLDLTPGDDGDS